MSKVLLIAPYVENGYEDTEHYREDFMPSLALVHLASYLRDNSHEPVILDLNTQTTDKQSDRNQYCKNKIIETIRDSEPDLVGLNCLFSGVFPQILKYVKEIKSNFPDMKIAAGGRHPTTYCKEILERSDIDYIALGEGEIQLIQMADCYDTGDFTALEEIDSFAYKNDRGEVCINRNKAQIRKINELKIPAWDLMDFEEYALDLSHYYNPKNHEITNLIPVLSSRGCPYLCNFCDMSLLAYRKFRALTGNTFVDQLEVLNKEYGLNYFLLMDDNATLVKKRMMDICEEIIKRKLDIQFEGRGGFNIPSLDEELIAAMAEAGLVSASIAIEHGSDYIRNTVVGKGTGIPEEKIYEVVDLLKKYKVMTGGLFIMGFPEETNETLNETYEMIKKLKLDRNGVATLIPFPGTDVFKQSVRDNLFVKEFDLDSLWCLPISHAQTDFVIKPYNMSLADMYEWRKRFDKIQYEYVSVDAKPKQKKRIVYKKIA